MSGVVDASPLIPKALRWTSLALAARRAQPSPTICPHYNYIKQYFDLYSEYMAHSDHSNHVPFPLHRLMSLTEILCMYILLESK